MSADKGNVAIVGAGVAACAVCCAGPIAAALAAIGIGTAAGVAVFGVVALLVGTAAAAFVVLRRRRRAAARAVPLADEPVPVEIGVGRRP